MRGRATLLAEMGAEGCPGLLQRHQTDEQDDGGNDVEVRAEIAHGADRNQQQAGAVEGIGDGADQPSPIASCPAAFACAQVRSKG